MPTLTNNMGVLIAINAALKAIRTAIIYFSFFGLVQLIEKSNTNKMTIKLTYRRYYERAIERILLFLHYFMVNPSMPASSSSDPSSFFLL